MALNHPNLITISGTGAAAEGTQFGVSAPTLTVGFTEGDTFYVTDSGTSTGTITEHWRFDGVQWNKSPSSGAEKTTYGTTAPTSTAGANPGDTHYVTPLGTQADRANATEQWRFDGAFWVKEASPKAVDGLTTAQPTPTATGNTTNLNTIFRDATGAAWLVDDNGDAVQLSAAQTFANWSNVLTEPPATGNTGVLPRFVENVNTGNRYYIDSAGTAKLIEGGNADCGTVFFNGTDPATATIFDNANPPALDKEELKNVDCSIYIGTDGSVWSSDGTTYSLKLYNAPIRRFNVRNDLGAGATTFTLSSRPIGTSELAGTPTRDIVRVSRNGVDISRSWTWVGAVGTYNPVRNFDCTLDQWDMMAFEWDSF